ncbi:MAG TPA: AAA family ATPase [Candidatus Aminicenantes bacterium]|nr:AAA family ATPase [Candidatus Aminicenantes bacterium]
MKQVIVLVGPKGAGKTTIGEFLAGELGIRFLRVEPLFLEAHVRLGASHPDPDRLGFEAVLASLAAALRECDVACLESTGASPHFPWLLAEMGRLARVALVRVLADPAQCIARIRGRDASVHIPVSQDDIARINALACRKTLPWDAVIDNRGRFDGALIRQAVQALIAEGEPGHGRC